MIQFSDKRGFAFMIVGYLILAFFAGSVTIYELEKNGIIKTNSDSCLNNSRDNLIKDDLQTAPIEAFKKTDLCGNGICDSNAGEIGGPDGVCLEDCACGNGKCEPGENPNYCKDCCGYCGDGKCVGYACQEDNKTSQYYCPKQTGGDCGNVCGNKICEKGETPDDCAKDCIWQKCGDGECTPDDGGPALCPEDCASVCGDCSCDGGEDYIKCPNDCGYCGDLVCSNCTQLNENSRTCSKDCQ